MWTGVRSDDPLPEIGQLKTFVSQVMLDAFDHRPLEEEPPGLVILTYPLLELIAGGARDRPRDLHRRPAEVRREAAVSRRRTHSTPGDLPMRVARFLASQSASSSQS